MRTQPHSQAALGDPSFHLPAPSTTDSYKRWDAVGARLLTHIRLRSSSPHVTDEEQAAAQRKILCESIDMVSDKTAGRNELQMAFQQSDQLGGSYHSMKA